MFETVCILCSDSVGSVFEMLASMTFAVWGYWLRWYSHDGDVFRSLGVLTAIAPSRFVCVSLCIYSSKSHENPTDVEPLLGNY